MSHADFVHLRVHSAYSLSEGAVRIGEMVELSRRHAMPAVAITDSSNLFGALEFSEACAKGGVQPIIGCALGLDREEGGHNGRRPDPDVLVLLCQDEVGYRNLLKLSSKAFLETESGETPHVAWSDLEAHAEGLIALTAGPAGAVGRLLADGQGEAAEAALLRLAAIYPGRLYVELLRHGLPVEQRIEAPLLDLAFRHDLPLLATNEVFFPEADMYEAHDALICVAEGAVVRQQERRRLTPEHRFKSAEEMRILFADLPEAIANTLVVARRCAYRAPVRDPILPKYPLASGRSEAEELRAQAEAGLERRLEEQVFSAEMDPAAREAAAAPYRERLMFELGVIIEMDYPGYFLIVADFIKWAKERDIPVGPGRGSGAGSVVAWSLTITDLDPLRFGLLFERFLNPERVSMPDFDIDFCQDRRDEVIHYVQQKYGHDQVAQIITFGTLQARAALRDVGRVLEMPYNRVDGLCKMVPNNPASPVKLNQAIEGEPRLQAARDDDPRVARLLDIALRLEGLYRHASTHAAGLVIGDRPLDELIPLYRDPRSEMPVTQFSMKYAELSGLVKFDFLGLKTLTVLDRARRLLAARGIEIDLDNLPLADRRTYELLGHGDAVGVFQLESSGMRDVLRKLRPDSFEDVIALVALFRPGPMDNIPRFIACKHGDEQPDYLHERLEGILKETYGVIIYQEQVMEIAKVLSGYSLGQADLLRRAMGKKIKAEMDAQREHFVEGAVAEGVERHRAVHIFELVAKFAGYGFNKSHAAAYALIAYQTAWVKANHPVEFLAASMTLDLGNTDKLNVFRQELERLGIDLLQPDINRSGVEFTVEADGTGRGQIRYALAAIKNVGRQAMKSVIAEREANGPYSDLFDFARRLDPRIVNKRQLENLARAGAFDGLNPNRAQVCRTVDLMLREAGAAASERDSQQVNLFGEAEMTLEPPSLPDVPPWPDTERLTQEFEAIGFYLSAHPLDAYAKTLQRLGVVRVREIPGRLNGEVRRLKLAGAVLGVQERTSARGNRFAFVQLSDPSGVFEVTVFSDVLSACRDLIAPGSMLVVSVDARIEEDTPRLTAQAIQSLERSALNAAAGLKVYLDDPRPLDGLKTILAQGAEGRGAVTLVLALQGGHREVEVALPGGYAVSPAVRAAVKAVPGIVDVQEV
jgi:DNA polymerase-3 subunit alpha